MGAIRHFKPLEEVLEKSPYDFNFIRSHVFMAMFHKDADTRTYAEIILEKYYGHVIKHVFREDEHIYLEISNGEESREVYLADVPDQFAYAREKIHPISFVE